MSDLSVMPRDTLLRTVAADTAALTGEDFFKELVRSLARTLNVRCAFVSEFRGFDSRVRTVAYYESGRFVENVEYDIRGTPCELVARGEVGYYPRKVRDAFPANHAFFDAHSVESYLAIPMVDRYGMVLGHLAAFDSKPMQNPNLELSLFKIFGSRAAAELERRRVERALADSERRLANVLGSAMDAIVTVDTDRRITLFNRAAEQVFRLPAADALGQPLQRLFAPAARPLLERYLQATAADPARQLWVPRGLHGLRATGEEFPVEATISPLRAEGACGFTVILRDVDERENANLELRRLHTENRTLQEVMQLEHQIDGFIGGSPAMQRVFDAIHQVADADSTVLLTGETGTGKELIARALHGASARRERPLVPVNCAALPAELIESELFGHERGAFTGATGQRKGRFELANSGTIFLDEVGELTPQAQAKLLRVLQEQCFERVGGTQSICIDVRVIAATNRDLEAMVAAGQFRADLFYRLNVFPIHVPPLRERGGDVPLLAQFFLEKFGRKLGKPFEGFQPESLDRLGRYPWPGNVRELQNVIERAVILGRPPLLQVAELMPAVTAPGPAPASTAVEDVVRSHILAVLERHDWVIEGPRGAAAVLEMKPSTLRYRMRQLGVAKAATTAAR